ncbi:MAG: hypothetical protein ACE5HO_21635 [bacterium]
MDSLINSLDEITIQIDSEAAKAYKSASPDEKKKIQFLISTWLKEVASKDKSSLKQLMDGISAKAQARGLTPEILEAILSEK